MHGTGERYGKTGKKLGAALKHIFRLLEQKKLFTFFFGRSILGIEPMTLRIQNFFIQKFKLPKKLNISIGIG